MESKKIISLENFVLFAGLGYLAYWLFKKSKGAITIDPKMNESVKIEKPKTIVLDFSQNKNGLFPSNMAKDYDYAREKTFAPARTVITEF